MPIKTSEKKQTVAKEVAPVTVAKKGVKHPLAHAVGEQCFWTTDGRVISNLIELQQALGDMADEVFVHHVTKEKNDFADWIENVLGDVELAKNFRTANGKD